MKTRDLFQHSFKAIRKSISPDVRKSVDFSIPSMPMVEACRADDFDFFAPFIAAGELTVGQMQHACQRYYLGKTKSGQPVFWMMDDMLRPLDAHIGSSAWLSSLLKAREPLIASWCVTHCLFGLHLLAENCFCPAEMKEMKESASGTGCTQKSEANISAISFISAGLTKTVCVVEAERSAVILSEIFPEYVWMAYATTAHLCPELFAPLQGHKVVLLPRTDPTLSTYLFFKDLADLVSQQYEIEITVSRFLEDHATIEQKERCVDLVEFIFDDIERSSQPPYPPCPKEDLEPLSKSPANRWRKT
jgi:hypothetical protein